MTSQSTPDLPAFNKAVAKFFAPLAASKNLAMKELSDGIYEVVGTDFTTRIRQGTGHRRDILVTLLPTAERTANAEDLSNEIGLGVVAEFCGIRRREFPLDTEDEYLRSAGELAAETEQLLLPYLLGDRTDYTELKGFVHSRSEKAVREITVRMRKIEGIQ